MVSLSPLSLSLSLSLPHHLTISAPKLPKIYTKPTLILCKSSQPQQARNNASVSVSETQIFIERQLSMEAGAEENRETKTKKKKVKKEKALKVSMAVASCYGCGAPLQTSDSDAPGYVDTETYELVDLLPKGTDFYCIGDWVVEATTKKKIKVLSVHLTSSKS